MSIFSRRDKIYVFGLIFSLLASIFVTSPLVAWATAPSVVTAVVPVPGDGQVTLTWTNPASVDFTGTMVRYSASAFPTSTSDGTLASDVAGTVSGSSSVTVTGLSNGTIYYFSLFSHNSTPEYSAAVNAQQLVMKSSFSDDFQSDSVAAINGQNGWATIAGTWTVVDTSGAHTLKSGTDSTFNFDQYRVLNGGAVHQFSNQMVRMDWKGSTNASPGQVVLRAQSATADAGGYLLTMNATTLRLNVKTSTGTGFTLLTTGAFSPVAGTWYTYEFSAVNNSSGLPVLTAYVWARGSAKPSTPTLTYTDTFNRFSQGVFSVGKSGTTAAEYDNVVYYGMLGDSSLTAVPDDGSEAFSWTNPTNSTYAGTMVRRSSSAYPATISDGTLVANVTGSSGATSTTTDTGLTNGTTYYYTLFPYDSSAEYGTPQSIAEIPEPALFSDNFDALTLGNVNAQNGWQVVGGTWTVTDASPDRVLAATDTTAYTSNMAVNGNSASIDQVVSYRFQTSTTGNPGGNLWLRHQSNNDGYLIWHSATAWKISYQSGATFTDLATSTAIPPPFASTWFNVEASIIDNGSTLPVISVYVWQQGMEKPLTPTVTVTDSSDRFASGAFGFERTSVAQTDYFDDVHFAGTLPPSPALAISSPAAEVVAEPDTATLAITDEFGTFYIPYIQTSTTLTPVATYDSVPVGGGIRFVLNEGLSGEQTIDDLSGPTYSVSFTGLAKAEYTLDAYVIEADGVTASTDPDQHDYEEHIAVGDIISVLGDSTSEGVGGTIAAGTVTNWLEADAGSLSVDHRNFPQHGSFGDTFKESFLTDLNDQLAAYYGYPVFLMNESVSGIRASDYQSNVMLSPWQTRELALAPNKWLLDLGNGDSQNTESASTYITDMESLITTLTTSYGATDGQIYVPDPWYDDRDPELTYLTDYVPAIATMREDLGLGAGPDLFDVFAHYKPGEYSGVHPSDVGYEHIARLWALALMQPTVAAPVVSGRTITLSWNDLSAFESSVTGYQISYGTASDNLNQTATVGAVQTATLTNLNWGTTYYYSVKGLDNDSYVTSTTGPSVTASALTEAGDSLINVSGVSGDTTEAGATATFTVVLSSQPTGSVTIPVSTSDSSEGTVSPSSLTFSTANWDTPQTVTATGVDDFVDDGNVSYSAVLGAATSTDVTYSGFDASDAFVLNVDDDTFGVQVSAVSGDTSEAGATATFTVVLSSQPTDSVVIPVSSSNTSEGTVSPSSLTFTTDNWNVPQTVLISGVNDSNDDGDIAYSVVLGAATSTDGNYSGLDAADVALHNVDNDVGGAGTAIQSTSHQSSSHNSDSSGSDSTDTGTGSAGGSSSSFSDLPSGSAAKELNVLVEQGIFTGNPDGSFKPGSPLNRAEAATLFGRILKLADQTVPDEHFSDVPSTEWYAPYVSGLSDLGLIQGNPDGTFLPADEVNRASFFKLAMNVFLRLNPSEQDRYNAIVESAVSSDSVDVDNSAWYADSAKAAVAFGFVEETPCGDSGVCFYPEKPLTRLEVSKILYLMFQ